MEIMRDYKKILEDDFLLYLCRTSKDRWKEIKIPVPEDMPEDRFFYYKKEIYYIDRERITFRLEKI
jgi:hypothetical protein